MVLFADVYTRISTLRTWPKHYFRQGYCSWMRSLALSFSHSSADRFCLTVQHWPDRYSFVRFSCEKVCKKIVLRCVVCHCQYRNPRQGKSKKSTQKNCEILKYINLDSAKDGAHPKFSEASRTPTSFLITSWDPSSRSSVINFDFGSTARCGRTLMCKSSGRNWYQ